MKILVPIDFSQPSKDALTVAHQLAKKLDARLALAHVLEIPLPNVDVSLTLPTDYVSQAQEGAKAQMKALTKRQRITDVAVEYHVLSGSPYRSIIRDLLRESCELVVMGSKGASGDHEVLIGSNAERMVRLAHCPVLVVKEKFRVDQVKHIVFATSLREYDEAVIAELKTLQQTFGAHLHLLRVNTPQSFLNDPFTKQRLRALAEAYHLKNYTVHTYSDQEEEEGIIHFAQENGAHLIALTTHGHRGLRHLFSGSVTEDVANHTKLPVWTLNLHPITQNQSSDDQ
jgi:nucleotide-binding universal stress UspA family protein